MDFRELTDGMDVYFGQLNDEEKYAWMAAALGFLLFVVGIVLVFW